MNLKFKSSEPDLKFNIQSQFRILNQNVLYLTRELDSVKRMIQTYKSTTEVAQQALDYYMERDSETSPQTDSDEQ